jgi:hypothetical protein
LPAVSSTQPFLPASSSPPPPPPPPSAVVRSPPESGPLAVFRPRSTAMAAAPRAAPAPAMVEEAQLRRPVPRQLRVNGVGSGGLHQPSPSAVSRSQPPQAQPPRPLLSRAFSISDGWTARVPMARDRAADASAAEAEAPTRCAPPAPAEAKPRSRTSFAQHIARSSRRQSAQQQQRAELGAAPPSGSARLGLGGAGRPFLAAAVVDAVTHGRRADVDGRYAAASAPAAGSHDQKAAPPAP